MSKYSLLIVTAVILASCSTSKTLVRSPKYRAGSGYASEDSFSKGTDRTVIYNASLTIAVENADSLNKQLVNLTQEYEGYAVTLGNKSSSIRVQASHLDEAIKRITKLGKVKHKTISGDDVTEEYKDYSIRLDNATQARARYLELLAKAENVESTLKVEKELERLNTEIETLKARLEGLDHLSTFSTISITIIEKQKPGIIGYAGLGVYKAVRWLFVRV
ncbi:MAG TPA: DUF4349 domain-containing protein [Ohtaekwangia sp.]